MSNFTSEPGVDPSVLQQMAYKSNYTETINKQMRVPDTITVAEQNGDYPSEYHQKSDPMDYSRKTALNMAVPDRIIVSGQYHSNCIWTTGSL